jgi:S-disulfanyl-L-cysteine oxidoreductase SoxD
MATALRRRVLFAAILGSAGVCGARVSADRPILLETSTFRRPLLRSASPSAVRPRSILLQSPTYGVGRPPAPEELKSIDIDVAPDGSNLPAGSGTAAAGKEVYARRCETCHGPTGTEGPQDVLAGGRGSLTTARPQKTVGSYWPYATTLWDYIRRAMPFDHPGTLTVDEVYASAAYVLFLNGIVNEHDVLDQTTLPKVNMPNRHGFVADPRPDVSTPRTQRAPRTQRNKPE